MKLSGYLPIYKKNLQLAIPIILSQAGQVSVSLIDTMMVGHVGTTELAAAAFANNVFLFGMLLGIGITIGITPLTGHSYGKNDQSKVGEWLKNGIFSHVLIAVALLSIMSCITPFMNNMGQSPEVVKKAVPYYLLLLASFFPMILFFSFKQFLEGIGNTKIAMIITIAVNILNIILNYIFIFGKLGIPAMGLNGAGLSTLIARFVMPIMIFTFIRTNKKYNYLYHLAVKAKLKWKRIVKILSIGLPIGLQMLIEIMAFSFGAIMMGWMSKESLAAHQVAIGMASFTFMISLGLASGTTIRISHLIGQNKLSEMKHVIYASLHMVIFFMSMMGISFIVFRYQLPYLFTNDIRVVEIAVKLLIVGALFQIFDGVQVVLIGTLRGFADVRMPMILAFVSYIMISLPTAYVFAFVLGYREIGIWIGFLVGLGTAAILFWTRMQLLIQKI